VHQEQLCIIRAVKKFGNRMGTLRTVDCASVHDRAPWQFSLIS